MMTDQNYQRKVEQVVKKVSMKYVNRKSIFEPLSKILPNYWNDIFLSAVKKIMFKRVNIVPACSLNSILIWVIKDPARGTTQIAKAIIEYERLLTQLIYRKNGWGDPYRIQSKPTVAKIIGFEYKKVTDGGAIFLVSLMDFKRKYSEVLRRYEVNDETADGILEAVYKTIHDAYNTGNDKGFSEGVKAAKKTQSTFETDQLIDIYNNLELGISDLKNIIDKS